MFTNVKAPRYPFWSSNNDDVYTAGETGPYKNMSFFLVLIGVLYVNFVVYNPA
jgi:hypothetical protein